MRQLVTKYQPPGVVNKAGEIFVDEVTGQIKIGDGISLDGSLQQLEDFQKIRSQFRTVARQRVQEKLNYIKRKFDALVWKPNEFIEAGMCRYPTIFLNENNTFTLKIHRAVTSGVTGESEPTWTTSDFNIAAGTSVTTDGGVTWNSYNLYFVDSVNGNDTTGDGSQATPWQTLAKITCYGSATTAVVRSGRAICLKKGSLFNHAGLQPGFTDGRLYIMRDTTDTQLNPARINIFTYGSGSMPIIDATGLRFGIRSFSTSSVRHQGFMTISGIEVKGDAQHASNSFAGIYCGGSTPAEYTNTPNSVKIIGCRVNNITNSLGTAASADINGIQLFCAFNGVYDTVINNVWDDGLWELGAHFEVIGCNVSRCGISTTVFPSRQRGDCMQIAASPYAGNGDLPNHNIYVAGNIIDHSSHSQKHAIIINPEVTGNNTYSRNYTIEWNDIIAYRGSAGATCIGLYCSGFVGNVNNNIIDVGHSATTQSAIILFGNIKFMNNIVISRNGMRAVTMDRISLSSGTVLNSADGTEIAYNTFISLLKVGTTAISASSIAGTTKTHSNFFIGWGTALDTRVGTTYGYNAYYKCDIAYHSSTITDSTTLGNEKSITTVALDSYRPISISNPLINAGKVSYGEYVQSDVLGVTRDASNITIGAFDGGYGNY